MYICGYENEVEHKLFPKICLLSVEMKKCEIIAIFLQGVASESG